MSQRRCHRCGSEVHAETEGVLVYCFHCGAPQIVLSEELHEQAAQLLARQGTSTADNIEPSVSESSPASALDWKLLIRIAAAVAGVLTLLSLALAPFALLMPIWAPLMPAVVLAYYAAKMRGARLDFRSGAHVGLVCGLLIVAGQAIAQTAVSDIVRFGTKHSTDFDAEMNTALAPLRTQLTAQYGAQSTIVAKLAVPEFRAGLVLAGCGTIAVVVLALAWSGGAIAGHLRSRTRPV